MCLNVSQYSVFWNYRHVSVNDVSFVVVIIHKASWSNMMATEDKLLVKPITIQSTGCNMFEIFISSSVYDILPLSYSHSKTQELLLLFTLFASFTSSISTNKSSHGAI
eukprot:433989_1